jgi:hypothetical protein
MIVREEGLQLLILESDLSPIRYDCKFSIVDTLSRNTSDIGTEIDKHSYKPLCDTLGIA